MTRTQISFDDALYRQARIEARRRGISLAELCRQAVARALAESHPPAEKPWTRFSGALAGVPSESADVDAVVYGAAR